MSCASLIFREGSQTTLLSFSHALDGIVHTLIWRHRWRCVFCCRPVVRLGGSLPSSLTKAFRKGWLRKSACARTTALLAFFALWGRAAGGAHATDGPALSAASSCKQCSDAGYILCTPHQQATLKVSARCLCL